MTTQLHTEPFTARHILIQQHILLSCLFSPIPVYWKPYLRFQFSLKLIFSYRHLKEALNPKSLLGLCECPALLKTWIRSHGSVCVSVINWHRDRFLSQYVIFPLSVSFYRCSILILTHLLRRSLSGSLKETLNKINNNQWFAWPSTLFEAYYGPLGSKHAALGLIKTLILSDK